MLAATTLLRPGRSATNPRSVRRGFLVGYLFTPLALSRIPRAVYSSNSACLGTSDGTWHPNHGGRVVASRETGPDRGRGGWITY